MKYKVLIICMLSFFSKAFSQVLTKEDSLSAGINPVGSPSVLSGYGEAKFGYNLRNKTGVANLTRNVLFFGHRFNRNILFFSEMELENAKVSAESPGEISMEQLFLKINLSRNIYLTTGLFIPRIGIINENHLPTTFNGNDRPYVETFIIPSTWRELGVGLYGNSRTIPGLNYSAAIVNGLNASSFKAGTGIREGRFEGSFATASNLAVTGALLYYTGPFRIQISGYYGGASGLPSWEADSLHLQSGAFGNPVALGEVNVQYHKNGLSIKVLAAGINISQAQDINAAYASNTPKSLYGAYAEIGYNIFNLFTSKPQKNLSIFARYETLDMNYQLPENGVYDGLLKKKFIVAGITYQPIRGIAFKLDYVNRKTGDLNQSLHIVNPYDPRTPFYNQYGFVNIGMAYSF